MTASAKQLSPFHALIVLGKNDCPYCLKFIWYFFQAPLYTLISTHSKVMCAKPLIILSPFGKTQPSQIIKHIRNTRVSCIPTFNEPCSVTLHPLNFIPVGFWYRSHTGAPYSIKERIK